MGANDDTIAAAAVARIVLAALPRDEAGQRGRESLEITRCGKADFRVHREGEKSRALLVGARLHARHLADDVSRRIDQMCRGKAILDGGTDGARRTTADDRRIDDERLSARRQDPLDASPPLPGLDQFEQTGILQRAQVVVQALPSHREFRGELRRRGRLTEALEQPPPHRRQGGADALRVID